MSDGLYDKDQGFLRKYKSLQVGRGGWGRLLAFELVSILFGNLRGAPGLFLRSKLYRPFFASIGRNVLFGAGVVIRNPGCIHIGDDVVLDDNCLLDAKGEKDTRGIYIGNRVFLSRNVVVGLKNGTIRIGDEVSMGIHSAIHSVEESEVTVGAFTIIAAYTYIVGSPNYRHTRRDLPIVKQGSEEGLGIRVGEDVWLGADVTVLDGSIIGDGAVVGAKALVRGDIPAYAIAYGVPARVTGHRADPEQPHHAD